MQASGAVENSAAGGNQKTTDSEKVT
jgi:hypothetical protein